MQDGSSQEAAGFDEIQSKGRKRLRREARKNMIVNDSLERNPGTIRDREDEEGKGKAEEVKTPKLGGDSNAGTAAAVGSHTSDVCMYRADAQVLCSRVSPWRWYVGQAHGRYVLYVHSRGCEVWRVSVATDR